LHHVTAIKQAARVGTTCSTVGEWDRTARAGNWLIRWFQGGRTGGSAGRCEGKGRRRSTTLRTTRTCVCKTITRVHALASRTRARATHTRAQHGSLDARRAQRERAIQGRMFRISGCSISEVTLSLPASSRSRASFSTKDEGLIESVLLSFFADHEVTE